MAKLSKLSNECNVIMWVLGAALCHLSLELETEVHEVFTDLLTESASS